MAKRKKEVEVKKDFDESKYDQYMSEQIVSEMIENNYMPYAMSVIITRALPDVRDGMKPAQRKVLYTMKNMNLTPGHKSKSANIAGTTLRLNPHSDQSCYETMVRMVDKNETLLAPYVAGKGSFGKHYSRDMAFAASRYCVTGDTFISTDNGIMRMTDIVPHSQSGKTYENIDLKVKSIGGKINTASKFFNSGMHSCYTIKLENGMKITGTPNHPLLTLDENDKVQWKLINDLGIDDWCIVDLDDSNILYGENEDIEQAQDMAIKIINKELINIPEEVFMGSKQYIQTFLNNLFVKIKLQEENDEYSLLYKSSNKELITNLQILLIQSFGIYCSIVKNKEKYALLIEDEYVYKVAKEIGLMIYPDLLEKLQPVQEYDTFRAVPVISKSYAGKRVVFSVKVDSKCHSFTANGFVNHNTEASLSSLGMELFKGINKNAVNMVDNYDGTMKEPAVLPVAFPAILANPTLGVAVGFASNICSFNLAELCNATIEHLKHPKNDLLDIMPAPDFSTGGNILYDKESMREIYNTGRGSIKMRAKYNIDKKHNRIEIKEIPFSTTAEAIVETTIELCKKGKIKEINDIRDDTDKNGLTISIDYKRTCDPEQLMLKLFKLTPLEDTYSCNFNVIVDGSPKCLGVYYILDEWINFSRQCIENMLNFEIEQLKHQLHLLRGLEKILLNIDKAIKIIKNTEKDIDVVPNLMKAFKIDEIQGEYIANMKLRNINKEHILNKTADIQNVENEIDKLQKQLSSYTEIKKIIIKDLQDIVKKFGIPRKTDLINANEVSFMEEETVKEIDVKIYLTSEGYIKKIPVSLIKDETDIKIKDNDQIQNVFDDNNTGDILIFTNKTNVFKLKISELPENKPQDFGLYINSLITLENDENIIFIHCTNDYKKNLMIVFENGKVALFPIKAYETKTNRKMLKNGFFGGSKVIFMDIVDDDETKYYILKNNLNKQLVFSNKNVSFKTSKTTQGIQIYRLTKNCIITECHPFKVTNKKDLTKYIPKNYPAAGK